MQHHKDQAVSRSNILLLVGEGYEDLELWYPKLRLQEAGFHVTVAAEVCDVTFKGKHGYPCAADCTTASLQAKDFLGIILPGGWMPDKLRRNTQILSLIQSFHAQKKLIAAICHGGWLAISAKVYEGVRVTGSPGIKDDLINAGAIWEDAPVVIDRHFVSSRRPDDLPAFCKGMLQVLDAALSQAD